MPILNTWTFHYPQSCIHHTPQHLNWIGNPHRSIQFLRHTLIALRNVSHAAGWRSATEPHIPNQQIPTWHLRVPAQMLNGGALETRLAECGAHAPIYRGRLKLSCEKCSLNALSDSWCQTSDQTDHSEFLRSGPHHIQLSRCKLHRCKDRSAIGHHGNYLSLVWSHFDALPQWAPVDEPDLKSSCAEAPSSLKGNNDSVIRLRCLSLLPS